MQNASGLKLEGEGKSTRAENRGNDRGYAELYNKVVMLQSVC